MPHLAASTISAWLAPHAQTPPKFLTADAATAAAVEASLLSDGAGLYYSACVSFSEAIRGLASGSFAWSTVKLYYCCFYCVRSILCFNGIAIFYVGKTPYSLVAKAGERPKKEKGVTHEVVWTILSREFSNFPLLGQIASVPAHSWMKVLRETANYKDPKFPDPNVPEHFSAADGFGLTKAIDAYRKDNSMLYAFDPDHACIAYPIEFLKKTATIFERSGATLDQLDDDHVLACLGGVVGQVPPLPWK
jgi:hypothetical protein